MFVRKLLQTDWQLYKAMRLEALSKHEGLFGVSHETEAAYEDRRWQDNFADEKSAYFGLFDHNDIVGITAVFTSREDVSCRTALLAASYIREVYRGKKLSRLLYEARIDWARASARFDRVVVGHRRGQRGFAPRQSGLWISIYRIGKPPFRRWHDGDNLHL